jgi:hypothetical protein
VVISFMLFPAYWWGPTFSAFPVLFMPSPRPIQSVHADECGVRDLLLILNPQYGYAELASQAVMDGWVDLGRAVLGRGGQVLVTRFAPQVGGAVARLAGMPAAGVDAHASAYVPAVDRWLEDGDERVRIASVPGYSAAVAVTRFARNGDGRVLLVGAPTDGSVLATAFDLMDRGYHPVVVSDLCVSDRGPAAHEAAIGLLRHRVGVAQVPVLADLFPARAA